MSKKTKLTEREKDLVAKAQASLLVAEIKEDGLLPSTLKEGLWSGTMDFLSGGGYSAATGAMERGGKGGWAMAAAYTVNAAEKEGLLAALEELKSKADDGIATTKTALDTITDKDTKKFFEQSIEQSASRIAAVQENELQRIANAVVKRVEAAAAESGDEEKVDDQTKKALTAMIVQGAMLGALVLNLK